MTTAPLGFDADGVLSVRVQPPPRDYDTREALRQLYDAFLDRLRALPGVTAVASASSIPTAVFSRMGFTLEGTTPSDGPPSVALFAAVSDDYFGTLRIPVRQGRTFDARDRPDAPPVIIVSESLARQHWPGGNAVGSRLRIGPDVNAPLMEVVGVVGDVRNDRAAAGAEPMLYSPMRQMPWPFANVIVRAEGDPLALVRPIERELAAIDPALALHQRTTISALLADGLAGRRVPVLLMTAFGSLALLVACVGVYALFAGMAGAREREFGVRMALGSRPLGVAALVLRQGSVWLLAGLAGGSVGVVLVTRLVRGLLYDVTPFDPLTLAASAAVLVACAAIALVMPLYRAMRVDPATALRGQ
jgi:predicted permease